ncbi:MULTISPECIES: IclR family transcriptional regulator [unclassified Brenneria]|uniref:IclR family transcriptional regulator n=1 Tax=unclassified Brenneria TaxID=2634434 RepID=UPI0015565A2D|nr:MULTISPECIES: IclR family transcriptional regulator [unclassified Brenneria]MBJ7220535.1 IclR family transcriptional regulator [Brenneria sp. L3-3C-1]MEE3641779.1 IclR family transcriptional regulator [Brenneria sp. L3_3C_1]MEE3649591.1 IclR family transcriptional regulator [Brenneria sp. HEZEL_4_2_4]NPC99549.1 IclR family transcriptional regulator [Brenneria sp. hezel4-2-4]
MSILNTTAAILNLMSQLKRGITAGDIITHLQLPKSTTSRVLKQLCETGFLSKDTHSATYHPALMLLEVAYLAHRTSSLTDDIEKALRALCHATGHTGYLSVLDGADILVLRVIPGRHALQVMTYPGTRSPCWATSTGRSLLSRFTPEQLHSYFDDTLSPESKTQIAFERLEEQLQTVREQRWSSAINEAVSGTASISCSVKNPQSGEAIAFCLTFPASMANEQEIQHLARQLGNAAMSIGKKYGDPYWLR